MSFLSLHSYRGYVKAESVTSDRSENSALYIFNTGGQETSRKKKNPKVKDDCSTSFITNNDRSTGSIAAQAAASKKKCQFEHYKIPLSKNDSLHSIAMKFGCSVWELKRTNRLWGLQDIHALTSVVVPAAKDSYRAELLSRAGVLVPRHDGLFEEDSAAATAAAAVVEEEEELEVGDLAQKASGGVGEVGDGVGGSGVRQLSLRQAMSSESLGGDCDAFLRTLDADLEQIKSSTCFLKDSLDEVAQYLTLPAVMPPAHSRSWYSRLKVTGVDCGLSWRGAVCLMLTLCLLLPLLLYLGFLANSHR